MEETLVDWEENHADILKSCAPALEAQGYRFVASRAGFEAVSSSERRGVYLTFAATQSGNHSVRIWCGIRNDAIEAIFHKTSGVHERQQSFYTTINIGLEGRCWLNSAEERQLAIAQLQAFIKDVALPFLQKRYTYHDYSVLLNGNPEGRCPYQGNSQNRCHYGLIAAKLSGDTRYEELKRQYSEFLRTTNKGFYYPRFIRFLEDISGGAA